MRRLALLFALPLLAGQDDPSPDDIRMLILRLGSEDVSERAEAAQKLKVLGQKVLPELREAATSRDAETAARARSLARTIEITLRLTAKTLKEVPGLAERMAKDPYESTRVFLKLTKRVRPDHTHIGRGTGDPLTRSILVWAQGADCCGIYVRVENVAEWLIGRLGSGAYVGCFLFTL